MPVRVRPVQETNGERAWVLFLDEAPQQPLAMVTDGDLRQVVGDYTAAANDLGAANVEGSEGPRRDTPSKARPVHHRGRTRRAWPAVLTLLLLAALVFVCLAWWQNRESLRDRFLRVRVGMTVAEAKATMGAWGCEVHDCEVSRPPDPRSQHLLELTWDDGSNWCSVIFGYEDRTVYHLREGSHTPTDGFFRRLLRSAGLSK